MSRLELTEDGRNAAVASTGVAVDSSKHPAAAASSPAIAVDRTPARRARTGSALPSFLAQIRRDLSEGVYSPRERLVEADLVARYGTTRAAAREALIQLTSEGLVERTPNRGARVRGMDTEEAIQIAEVRRLLESLCARRAAERATPAELKQFEPIAKALKESAELDHVNDYLLINARFHAAIYAMADHATARQILENFQHRPIDRFFPQPFRPTPPAASVSEHERIAAAIIAGDADAAESAMYDHLTSLIDSLQRYARPARSR